MQVCSGVETPSLGLCLALLPSVDPPSLSFSASIKIVWDYMRLPPPAGEGEGVNVTMSLRLGFGLPPNYPWRGNYSAHGAFILKLLLIDDALVTGIN